MERGEITEAMDKTELENGNSKESSQLNRNRSFKSKQLVRSQAIRESQSPPRTVSPSVVIDEADCKPQATPDSKANYESKATYDSKATYGSKSNFEVEVSADADLNVNVNVTDLSSPDDRSDGNSYSDCNDDCKKKRPVEIQITSGAWDEPPSEQRQRTKRWLGHRQHSGDLLSNNPRVACVCGACTACPHCRGRRNKQLLSTKQDSGIVCSDDCADCSDTEGNENPRKASSVDDETYCRCPERKDKPKTISLSRTDSDEKSEPTGAELVAFIKQTLNKNARDRLTLLKIEKELHSLVSDPGRCIVRFPVMTSYGRMLVHRCASLFQLCHHLDHTNKGCVLVSKSGTSGGRIPCTSFKQWCVTNFPTTNSPQRHQQELMHAKSILKREGQSFEGGSCALSANRSKSLEQREKEYERVRRRIFSTDNCNPDESQWQWLSSGPVKLLTADGGRNKLLKVQSLEGNSPNVINGNPSRGAVSKSHSFGGYGRQHDPPRLLSRQGDLASSSWRLSPSSSGYRTLSLHSTDSVTPSPTGGASPEPGTISQFTGTMSGGTGTVSGTVVFCVTDMSAVPAGALVIHPQTGRPLTNPDGSVYHFDPNNPPVVADVTPYIADEQTQVEPSSDKKRGKLEKQHSFIDNECDCRPSEECRSKCYCDCRTNDTCRKGDEQIPQITDQKPVNIPSSPSKSRRQQETPNQNCHPETPTNHRPPFDPPTNQKPAVEVPPNQRQYEVLYNQQTNQSQAYVAANFEPTNQRPERFENRPPSFDSSQKLESANQRVASEPTNHKTARSTNQNTPELQYVAAPQYAHGFSHEGVTSPPQSGAQYMHAEQMQHAASQMKHVQMADPNLRPMSLGMVYGMAQYPYPTVGLFAEEKPVPHNENTFRIDPSYPYAAIDYSSCQACEPRVSVPTVGTVGSVPTVPTVGSVPTVGAVGGVPAVGSMQPMSGVVPIEQLQCSPYGVAHHYPYGEGVQWPGVIQPLVQYNMPAVYQPYGLVYPQMMPQAYGVCQPGGGAVYSIQDRAATLSHSLSQSHTARRHSIIHTHSARNSISGSARPTPLPTPDTKQQVPYDESNNSTDNSPAVAKDTNEIAAKIQQIKDQMAQINVRDNKNDRGPSRHGNNGNDFKSRDDWRRNNGTGILGSYPVHNYNARVMGRPTNDENQLSSAARAIVNSIRSMQAKNNYHHDRRDFASTNQPQIRGEWRRRDDNAIRERDDRRQPPQPYRHDYLIRQMSPGTWCRRSPAPIHPVLNQQQPRRPHPDSRNARR